jgi:hypothetical protein
LERYLHFFSAQQILVIPSENLLTRRKETLQRVFGFLSVDDTFYLSDYDQEFHKSQGKKKKSKLAHIAAKLRTQPTFQKIKKSIPAQISQTARKLAERGPEAEKPKLDPELRSKICQFIKEDVQKLRKFTGEKFEHWQI